MTKCFRNVFLICLLFSTIGHASEFNLVPFFAKKQDVDGGIGIFYQLFTNNTKQWIHIRYYESDKKMVTWLYDLSSGDVIDYRIVSRGTKITVDHLERVLTRNGMTLQKPLKKTNVPYQYSTIDMGSDTLFIPKSKFR